MKVRKKLLSMMISAGIIASTLPIPSSPLMAAVSDADLKVVSQDGIIADASTVWNYMDDNTDPAGNSADSNYVRTSWTATSYDDSSWKDGQGGFGSKKGSATYDSSHTAATVLDGCDGANDTPAYFFRYSFDIQDAATLEAFNELTGTIIYDDGAIVYLNGTKIADGFNQGTDASGNLTGKEITENLQYGGSNQGPETLEIHVTDEDYTSLLKTGKNTLAVEIHQGRQTSSDVWFSAPEIKLVKTEAPVAEQSSISLSVGSDETQTNFTWYCNTPETGKVLIAEKGQLVGGEMPENAQTFEATVTAANKSGYYSNQATVTGLTNGTRYVYQLINGTGKSAVTEFKTAADSEYFTFAYAGDPQIGAGNTATDTTGWEKTLEIVKNYKQFIGTRFLLSAGDQVNTANNEDQYNGYLEHSTLYGLPSATIIGNHDASSNAYDQHFNVPNESGLGASNAGTDYYYVYNNVLFLMLNSNNMSAAEHKAFMEAAIAETADQNIEWKIVSFHHSIYSVASHAEDSDILARREALGPIFKELDIDVVLMGHDHVYCRTYMMDGLTPMTDPAIYDDNNYSSITDPEGILYVTANSASGSKFYSLKNATYEYSAVLNQEKVPNISRVDVSDHKLKITTYRTSDMSVVDTFTINHTSDLEAAKVSLAASSAVYTGSKIKPAVTVTYDGTKLVQDQDYTVAYTNNTKVGRGTVTITGMGNYRGEVQKSFKIVPKKAAIKSVTAGKGTLKVVTAGKVSKTGGSKYQIAYRQKGSTKWKRTTTTSYSKTIKNLKKGKYYYVKVRAMKTVSGKTYYGKWSTVKRSGKIK